MIFGFSAGADWDVGGVDMLDPMLIFTIDF